MSRVSIPITLLAHGAGLDFPAYASAEAAGCDLMAALPANEPLTLLPGQRCLIPTGLAVALPAGFEGQIRPRSGLALRHGVSVLNAPGTIDADYRGEIQVILVNLGELPFVIERGMRIAQFVLAPVVRAAFTPAIALDATERGEGGFGSTGFHAGGGSKN